MSENTRKFRREPAEQRKEALILATLSLIAEQGVGGATVRAIATRADVTQGMIRHHFSSKEELVTAAYEHHMNRMTNLTSAPVALADGSARARLIAFVSASLTPPVVDASSVTLWVSFFSKVREDTQMQVIHERTYHDSRNRLEALIAAVLNEADIATKPQDLRLLAIACNAVIDGLWMEGGALSGGFEPGELPEIGLRSVGAIIGVDLQATGHQA